MGEKPGYCEESNTFTLPDHENISYADAAERIAEHFSKISREFPPLDEKSLPDRVSKKIQNPESESNVPKLFEHDIYKKICQATKPKSGVQGTSLKG